MMQFNYCDVSGRYISCLKKRFSNNNTLSNKVAKICEFYLYFMYNK